MKAIVQNRYGSLDVLRTADVDPPTAKDGEVVVRVRAASVHPDVWHVVCGVPYVLRIMGAGLRRPKQPIPGTDMAGEVASVGQHTRRFKPGDEVFGETILGHQWTHGGAFAEHVAVAEDSLALKPERLSFEQAASVPTSGLIALRVVREEAQVRPGQQVLVNGAGGSLGVFAVQLARAFGAEVTAVDGAHKLDMLRSIGAAHVIDYQARDYTRDRGRYDVIIDIASNRFLSENRRALKPEGTYVLVGHDHFGTVGRRWLGSIPTALKLVALSPFVRQLPKAQFSSASRRDATAVLAELLETGKLTPVVDRVFPLAEAANAIRYLQSGQACGKIVLTI